MLVAVEMNPTEAAYIIALKFLGFLREARGEYTVTEAAGAYQRYLQGESTDNMIEMTYPDRKRVHNLKYFTWVEQQGVSLEEFEERASKVEQLFQQGVITDDERRIIVKLQTSAPVGPVALNLTGYEEGISSPG